MARGADLRRRADRRPTSFRRREFDGSDGIRQPELDGCERSELLPGWLVDNLRRRDCPHILRLAVLEVDLSNGMHLHTGRIGHDEPLYGET